MEAFYPNLDGTVDSSKFDLATFKNKPWEEDKYVFLPQSVRTMINTAAVKEKHEEGWNKLLVLNDKLLVFNRMLTSKLPIFEQRFLTKKKQNLSKQLMTQRVEYEFKVQQMMKAIDKKLQTHKPASNFENYSVNSRNNDVSQISIKSANIG